MNNLQKVTFFITNLILFLSFKNYTSLAQVVSDRTVNTTVSSLINNSYTINNGTIQGTNLYHSFSEFSPNNNNIFFNNSPEITNIITRVTGNSASNINSLISANGNANLFLINPNGINFGGNTTLNIGGSFIASTAETLLFPNNINYSAKNIENNPLLSINIPIGLQFGNNPGAINISGAENQIIYNNSYRPLFYDRPTGMEVSANSTFGLFANTINFQGGNITTKGGRIELGSVAGNNTINLTAVSNGFTANYDSINQFQDINMRGASSLNASGNRAGDMQIQGQNILLDQGSVIAANPLGNLPSGDVVIKGSESVILTGVNSRNFPSSLLSEVDVGASADGGSMLIDTKKLILENGGVISTGTFGSGNAGDLIINAREFVELKGTRAGNIPSFLGSEVNEEGLETGGDGATLTINTKRLTVRDGGSISTSTFNWGNGGDIIINASELVEVIGLFSEITTMGENSLLLNREGDSGNFILNTKDLIVRDGARIGGQHEGSGNGGVVEINADSLFMDNFGIITAKTESGEGGNIVLNINNIMVLRNGSTITTSAGGVGNGGNININTTFLVALENSDIIANAFEGNGGNIMINAKGIFGTQFRDFLTDESDITASSQFGLSGTVIINNPAADPTSGLITLPTEVRDPSKQIITGCAAASGNSFTITGRGGLPENPTQILRGQIVWQDLQTYTNSVNNYPNSTINNSLSHHQNKIVQATDLVINDQGNIELIANTQYPNINFNIYCHN